MVVMTAQMVILVSEKPSRQARPVPIKIPDTDNGMVRKRAALIHADNFEVLIRRFYFKSLSIFI